MSKPYRMNAEAAEGVAQTRALKAAAKAAKEAKLLRLHAEGLDSSAIAERLGMSSTAVYEALKKLRRAS